MPSITLQHFALELLAFTWSIVYVTLVGVGEGVGFGVGVKVGEGVGVGEVVSETLGVVDGAAEGVDDTVAESDGVGEGVTLMVTPLFQINFLPDLIHVNLLPWKIWVELSFVHEAPATGVFAKEAGAINVEAITISETVSARNLIRR